MSIATHVPPKAKRSLRSFLTALDDYTLWAFNPQPPLAPRRSGPGARLVVEPDDSRSIS
jgi:hypothetical protein